EPPAIRSMDAAGERGENFENGGPYVNVAVSRSREIRFWGPNHESCPPAPRLHRPPERPLRLRLRPALVLGRRDRPPVRSPAPRPPPRVAAASGSRHRGARRRSRLELRHGVHLPRSRHAGSVRRPPRLRRLRPLSLRAQSHVPRRGRGHRRGRSLPGLPRDPPPGRGLSPPGARLRDALRRARSPRPLRRELHAVPPVGPALDTGLRPRDTRVRLITARLASQTPRFSWLPKLLDPARRS